MRDNVYNSLCVLVVHFENFLFLARLNYTFIGSVRTFSEDITYLLQRLKLDDISASHRDKTDTFDVLKI